MLIETIQLFTYIFTLMHVTILTQILTLVYYTDIEIVEGTAGTPAEPISHE